MKKVTLFLAMCFALCSMSFAATSTVKKETTKVEQQQPGKHKPVRHHRRHHRRHHKKHM